MPSIVHLYPTYHQKSNPTHSECLRQDLANIP